MGRKLTKDEFIQKSILKHKGRYDYLPFKYINAKQHIAILCKTHGVFVQQISVHLRGFGCKKCSYKERGELNTKSLSKLLENISIIHSNKYTYPYIGDEYVNCNSVITINCPKHSFFKQTVNGHMSSKGCKKCALEYTASISRQTFEDIVIKATIKHSCLFKYINIEEILSNKNKIGIICKNHGVFHQQINNHLNGAGCPKCNRIGVSKPEREVGEYVKTLKYFVEKNNRKLLGGKELDIYIPSLKKAIEFNGEWWHYNHSNPTCKPRGYHAMKSNLCREKGIKLLHIREDLWKKDKNKMKEIIFNFLNRA